MRKPFLFLLLAIMVVAGVACAQEKPDRKEEPAKLAKLGTHEGLVYVKGGTMLNAKSSGYGKNVTLPNFYIGPYEVTQKEWMEVMGSNPSEFKGDHLPVEMVSWYDAVSYCNQRSIKEGLQPYYKIDQNRKDPNNKSEFDPIKWTVTIQEGANGYRLPTEAEWEYAASGGQLSKGYAYSGSDHADTVAWYWRNAGDRYLSGEWNWPIIENNHNQTKPIGVKKPNELGLYDMSGNVREWCWDWYEGADVRSGSFRVVKGGGWIGDVSNAEISFRGKFEASGFGPDQGFRVSRGE
ncbi:SUMF1/EgtB/PvdO family nonheme iron enzyme [Cohnella sp. REN36]|uniref:formylglycine-generating enzyme family protein n=1 Tax=Cohnella sp. REN36 TaxID=2887347 RepID=UPI001D133D51|nr:SUMF1/EgtB/PvdO family nonheme iron enzyme [Cohnella sp. REN36]MCC3371918.1 formylglycine-generating enzyme family protein [Cohnella sp. REN36]